MSNGQIKFQRRDGGEETVTISFKELSFVIEALEKDVAAYEREAGRAIDDDTRSELGMDRALIADVLSRLQKLQRNVKTG